ncbi:MAG: TSUP family transporter [Pseudomonadota bacterium]|nr:MAG: TSUP family transporter [Pseudomonadota bacterium]
MAGFIDSAAPFVWLIVFFAGLVHGALGLGFPLVATPLLALAMDVRSAVLVTLIPTISVNVISILKGGGWRQSIGRYGILALYVSLGSWVGTRILITHDPAPFKLVLAAAVLAYLAGSYLRLSAGSWIRAHTPLALLAFGLLAGLMAGTVNVMVPVLIILLLELHLAPTSTVQIFNWCFLAGKMVQTLEFARVGMLTFPDALAAAPLALVALAGLATGMALRGRFDTVAYNRALRVVLLVVAAGLMLQYLASL